MLLAYSPLAMGPQEARWVLLLLLLTEGCCTSVLANMHACGYA